MIDQSEELRHMFVYGFISKVSQNIIYLDDFFLSFGTSFEEVLSIQQTHGFSPRCSGNLLECFGKATMKPLTGLIGKKSVLR